MASSLFGMEDFAAPKGMPTALCGLQKAF